MDFHQNNLELKQKDRMGDVKEIKSRFKTISRCFVSPINIVCFQPGCDLIATITRALVCQLASMHKDVARCIN